MHIALDLQSCQTGSRLGGIGRYSLELAKAMVRRRSRHEFSLILSEGAEGGSQVRAAFADLIAPDRIRTFATPTHTAEFGNPLSMVRAAELVREQFLLELAPDCVHVSSLFEGLHEPFVTSVGQVYPSDRTAVTLYDLIPWAQKERYLADKRALGHYVTKLEYLKRAGLLLAISDFSRREASDLLNIDPERVVNISSAVDARFHHLDLSIAAQTELKGRFGIADKFLMYTGSFDVRKNHATLIRAFGQIPAAARANYQLLMVGNGWDGMYSQLRNVAAESGLKERDLVFAGHVAEADLVPLYNACSLFVFPSLAEGFGLPVLEAMSCGTPTLCSDTTSLPEVMGLPAAMFDPSDVKSVAARIQQALVDPDFRDALRAHGLERAKLFSWDESARLALAALEEKFEPSVSRPRVAPSVIAGPPVEKLLSRIHEIPGAVKLPDAAFRDLARCIATNHLTLRASTSIDAGALSAIRTGWVTSWNTRCGIAAYSKFLLASWPAPVTVFAPHTDWTTEFDGPNVVRCWNQGITDDLEDLTREILRENLEMVILQFNYGFFNLQSLERLINRLSNLGVRVVITFHSTQDPEPARRLKDIAPALQRCTALIVHTLRDTAALGAIGCKRNVTLLPQGVIESSKTAPARTGPGKTIATYGFALPNKGLMQVLEAFAHLRQHTKTPLRLLMVNAEYPQGLSAAVLAELAARVEELGLQDCVELHSKYLPEAQSLDLLRQADLIVNAYQQTGESSSAAIRMALASGRPVVVSPLPIFDDVKACTFALPGVDAEAIAAGLAKVFEELDTGSGHAQQIEAAADRWRAAHVVKTVTKALFLTSAKFLDETEQYDASTDYELAPGGTSFSFLGADPALKTQVGRVQGQLLVSTARGGHLLHGPYISAAPGQYRARLAGRLSGKGRAVMDVCAKAGALVLTQVALEPTDELSTLANISFLVPLGGVKDLEVRVEVDANVSLELARLHLEPVVEPQAE
ncbi:MAG: glycosyltransferase [Archangium sp.]|nr:glycosyltransferase [Archangium sp.]MDP3151041.1 glycosyltransferase [Archangium sp.]MDP3569786.1 glycosyltransferase [Archangium sp.]